MSDFTASSIDKFINYLTQVGGFMRTNKKALVKGLIKSIDCMFNYTRNEQQLLSRYINTNSLTNAAISKRGNCHA
ncbi:hypothetical protein [Pseudoalteromonas sp. APM04]|uniref:hypothetical protein n=1 Tax=Pseudoalteromonas sp. APM04 TaxID=2699396 RepID=UPI001FB3FDCC|nr:hypothetical protein [Pseudoalteromonas sp. APM04]UOB72483.1 hypothetical protein MTP24_10060 [Pseudoalteromonas sp. APM04]